MATIINASNTTGLTLTSDLSGVLQLQQNGVALPALSVAPAFSVYRNTTQSLSSSTFTKIQCNIEEFDTNNNYDNSTNYRFTPTVAGYYQINGEISFTGDTLTRIIIMIYKNGSMYKIGTDIAGSPNKGNVGSIIYFNGSTDYVELYGYAVGTNISAYGASGDPSATYFNGCLVRGA